MDQPAPVTVRAQPRSKDKVVIVPAVTSGCVSRIW